MPRLPLDFPFKGLFTRIFGDAVYLVGGTVRDYLLYGSVGGAHAVAGDEGADTAGDIDLVVVNHSYQQVEQKLLPFGKTNTVGKSFAVVKFTHEGRTFDVSVPRKDMVRDPGSHGHTNFLIESGPGITLEEDLGRRDFTCNSIAVRLSDGRVVDPFDGVGAVKARRIVMTGPETFIDDPLRILRAARFASVHCFTMDPEIYTRSRDVVMDELSRERVVEELFRLLLESPCPSMGMKEYFRLTVLEKLFPVIYPLTLTIQDTVFHPETDEFGHHTVWGHLLIALDIAKTLCVRYSLGEEESLALMLGVLFHDVGKAVTTGWEFKRGRMTITSILHDTKGEAMTEEFLTHLKIETRKGFPLKQTVLNLVKNHHRIYELYRNREEISYKAIARLVKDLDGRDFLLLLLDIADRRSRDVVGGYSGGGVGDYHFYDDDEVAVWYRDKKAQFNINRDTIQPIVMGRHLLCRGVAAGVTMGQYLKTLYERQLDGEFETLEQGLALFDKLFEASSGE